MSLGDYSPGNDAYWKSVGMSQANGGNYYGNYGGAIGGAAGYSGGSAGNAASNARAAQVRAQQAGTSGGYSGGLAGQYQQALDKANAANESRYQDILGQSQSLYDRTMQSYSQGNQQAHTDIDRSAAQQTASTGQNLTSRGLTGSTIKPVMEAGIERERVNQGNRADFDYAQQQRQADQNLTQQRLGVMERRTDQAPDFGQLAALSQAYGDGGGGGQSYGGGINWASALSGLGSMGGGGGFYDMSTIPTYGGNSNGGYGGGMTQQQKIALQKANGYNSGYSLQGSSSGISAGPLNYQVLGTMPDYSYYA